MSEKNPRITLMGKEIPWDAIETESIAVELSDYFKQVKLSRSAIDNASRIVPIDLWMKQGIYTWLSQRADFVFSKLPIGKTDGHFGKLKYVFEFDSEGPVLKTVFLG